MPFLPPNQQRQSTEGTCFLVQTASMSDRLFCYSCALSIDQLSWQIQPRWMTWCLNALRHWCKNKLRVCLTHLLVTLHWFVGTAAACIDCRCTYLKIFWLIIMEKGDKGSTMIRMSVSGWMFLLVPAYPGCPGSKAVKRSLLLLVLLLLLIIILVVIMD